MNEQTQSSRLRVTSFRASRLNLDFVVKVKTMGSLLSYELQSQNLSLTGLSLVWKSTMALPFQKDTLVEIFISPKGSDFDHEISFIGKIIYRIKKDNAADITLGVQLVQIEENFKANWETGLKKLQSKYGVNLFENIQLKEEKSGTIEKVHRNSMSKAS